MRALTKKRTQPVAIFILSFLLRARTAFDRAKQETNVHRLGRLLKILEKFAEIFLQSEARETQTGRRFRV
jgi:hypothetical protein